MKKVSQVLLFFLFLFTSFLLLGFVSAGGEPQYVNSESKETFSGHSRIEVQGMCGQLFILNTPRNADEWDISCHFESEMASQSIHITIYETIGGDPVNWNMETPISTDGLAEASLSAELSTSKDYVIWVTDGYAKNFTGYIEEEWNSHGPIFTLEPRTITIPDIIGTQETIISVGLVASDVNNLKEFHIDFAYDLGIVEYLDGVIDQSFYVNTGGWRGGELNGVLARTFSGSGTMFKYTFKVIGTGTTTIRLINSQFLDDEGNVLEYKASGSTVDVVTFEEYVDGLYQALSLDYDELSSNYFTSLTQYNQLLEDNDELSSEYSQLLSEYDQLIMEQISILSELDDIRDEYSDLDEENNLIIEDLEELNTYYNELQLQFEELQLEIESLQNKGIPGFPYVSIIIGLFIAIVLYLSNQS